MSLFVPSEASYADDNAFYGDAAVATADAAASPPVSLLGKLESMLSSAAPALSIATDLIGKSDREKLAILQAKVKNYKSLMNTPPYSVVPGKAWYQSEIRKMQAQIEALKVGVSQEDDTTSDFSLFRKASTAGVVIAGGVGIAMIYWLVRRARPGAAA